MPPGRSLAVFGKVGAMELEQRGGQYMLGIIWTAIVILFILWLAGFTLHVGGALIHLLLVIALVLIVFNLLTGRGARV